MNANDRVDHVPDEASAKRPDYTVGRIKIAVILALVVFRAVPADAQIFDGVEDILEQATTSFESVVASFVLLCGLVVAWMIGMKNAGAGIVTGVAVIAFAAMVANNENIAAEIGFGG